MGKPKALTAEDWDACDYPGTMLPHLRKADPRKLRLFLCACCRRTWHVLFDDRSRRAVEAAEAWADGMLSATELRTAQVAASLHDKPSPKVRESVNDVHIPKPYRADERYYYAARAARSVAVPRKDWVVNTAWSATNAFEDFAREEYVQTVLIREIFGNPFRPVAFAPSWRTSSVVALTNQMYESRDFTAMPIVADALQEAGCDHADILAHCRDPQSAHVRGCWVVDLVLGKS